MMRWNLIFFFLLIQLQLLSQVNYSNEFLQIGVGARAHALAGAVTASTSDINAAYWNVAGLSKIESPIQLGLMHSEWFGGVGKFDHIAIARVLNKERGRVGSISMIRLGIDQIPNTLNLVAPDGSIRFENVSEFSAADYGFILSYASAIGKIEKERSIRLGGNAKIIRRIIGPFARAWGFGADLGLQMIRSGYTIGIMAYDITTTFTGWKFEFTEEQKNTLLKSGNFIPVSSLEKKAPHVSSGICFNTIKIGKISVAPEIGFNAFFDYQKNTLISSKHINLDPKLGVEIDFNKKIFFRTGYGQIQQIKDEFNLDQSKYVGQLNAGIGININKQASIDYALANVANFNNSLNYSHIFSIVLNFSNEKSTK